MGKKVDTPGGGWYERNLSNAVRRELPKGTLCFQKRADDDEIVRVLVVDAGLEGWHCSVTCDNRLPTIRELRAARYHLVPPDQEMGIMLPSASEQDSGSYTINIQQLPIRVFEDPEGSTRRFSWKRRK